ncbi:putative secretion/efflux ABC transporter,ATP-binding protein fragment 2 [Helicobacter acinonychis str. Sheeba]|uniref:Secretion/efflux ABC transporter,ATP-binding protein 2 n=1 Tax=Helicobacter acinonychis (strain Sheeba) TaxID=382638 RepID=Q17W40_HELAH|nr:putative secretion/efflux ABC transporter,ATP-binding protein fragment 2 [Helicobacter acinonychis str. Sheeba]
MYINRFVKIAQKNLMLTIMCWYFNNHYECCTIF